MASRKDKADPAPETAGDIADAVEQAAAAEEQRLDDTSEATGSVEGDGIEEAEIIEDIPPETERAADDEVAAEPEPEPETDEQPEPQPAALPARDPIVVRKGGFLPMFLGGVAAAVIGFGAARVLEPEGWPWSGSGTNAVEQLEQTVAEGFANSDRALADVKAAIPAPVDLAPLTSEIDSVRSEIADLSARLGDAATRLDALDTRLTGLEKRPITEAASPAAVEAYERELEALQQAMATQRAEIEKLADEAARKEANAEMTAQEAMQRAAVSRIQTALDTGAGFADAARSLAEAGIAMPPALAGVADNGVASRAALAESFPEAARAALRVARKAEDKGGLGAFLKAQLGARSLEPREGDDADAVLSRAEAAVRDGRLADALAEIDALPEAARAELSDWSAQAATRLAALAAVEALADEIN